MLKIQTGVNNEILRKVSEEIKKDEIQKYVKLGKEMVKYIKNPENSSCGLAAPQIGYNKRLIAVSLLKNRKDENFITTMMINPVIIEHSEKTDCESEGCLSLPGKSGKVKRWKEIKLEYIDNQGKIQRLVLKGLQARIVMHEVDHLDGILFTDKVESNMLSI